MCSYNVLKVFLSFFLFDLFNCTLLDHTHWEANDGAQTRAIIIIIAAYDGPSALWKINWKSTRKHNVKIEEWWKWRILRNILSQHSVCVCCGGRIRKVLRVADEIEFRLKRIIDALCLNSCWGYCGLSISFFVQLFCIWTSIKSLRWIDDGVAGGVCVCERKWQNIISARRPSLTSCGRYRLHPFCDVNVLAHVSTLYFCWHNTLMHCLMRTKKPHLQTICAKSLGWMAMVQVISSHRNAKSIDL